MPLADNAREAPVAPVMPAGPMTCRCCGRELTTPESRVRSGCEAYCRICYARLLFPDVREADMESLD